MYGVRNDAKLTDTLELLAELADDLVLKTLLSTGVLELSISDEIIIEKKNAEQT